MTAMSKEVQVGRFSYQITFLTKLLLDAETPAERVKFLRLLKEARMARPVMVEALMEETEL